MARVVLTGSLRELAGGETELEIDAANVRQLLRILSERFPALGKEVQSGMAVAIDGEIIQDALLESLEPDSEVAFLPPIGGGAGIHRGAISCRPRAVTTLPARNRTEVVQRGSDS